MASTTAASYAIGIRFPSHSSSISSTTNTLILKPPLALSLTVKPKSPLLLKSNGGCQRFGRNSRFVVRCDASNGRITQQEFTEMAWQAVVSSPEIAKENKHQIVETEHLMKTLLEQKNGLARRIFSKIGVDNTRLLEATDKFIKRQPKVLGESAGSMLGRDLEALIQRAREFKKEYGDSFVSVEHLVLGFVQDQRFGKQLFKDFQISLQTLRSAIESIRGRQSVIDQDFYSLRKEVKTTSERVEEIRNSAGLLQLDQELADLESKAADSSFWDDRSKAQQVLVALTDVKDKINMLTDFKTQVEEAETIIKLTEEMDSVDAGLLEEATTIIKDLNRALDQFELSQLLSGPYDKEGAVITISAGAGGTDAQCRIGLTCS